MKSNKKKAIDIDPESLPSKVDQILRGRFKIGLHSFASVLYFVFHEGSVLFIAFDKWPGQPRREDLIGLQKGLLVLRKNIDHMIELFEQTTGEKSALRENFINKGEFQDWISLDLNKVENRLKETKRRKSYSRDFFDDLVSRKSVAKEEANARFRAPVSFINVILSVWANLIYKKRLQIKILDSELFLIAKLFDWFWEKIKRFDFYKQLNPRNISVGLLDVKNIRTQLDRNRTRGWRLFFEFENFIPPNIDIHFDESGMSWEFGQGNVFFPDKSKLI